MSHEISTGQIQKINDLYANANSHIAQALDIATLCGHALCEVKKSVPYGGWVRWINQNCHMSYRTATIWMTLAKNQTAIADSNASSIRQALQVVSKPRSQISLNSLYVIGDGRGHFKIGITSRDGAVRLAELQVGNPYKLTIVFQFELVESVNREVETWLHETFDHKRTSAGNEWFSLDANDIEKIESYVFQIEKESQK